MKTKRNDIRISRKFSPSTGTLKSTGARGYGLRHLKKVRQEHSHLTSETPTSSAWINERVGKFEDHRVSSEKESVKASTAQKKMKKNLTARKADQTKSKEIVQTSTDQKRRRSGAENYINKRFLYDVVEPPKRPRQKKFLRFSERSTASLMAVSSANLLKRHKAKHNVIEKMSDNSDLFVYLRSRRGRKLKPKHEYSPSHPISHENTIDEISSFEDEQRSHKKIKLQSKSSKYRQSLKSNDARWPKHNYMPKGRSNDNNHLTEQNITNDLNQAKSQFPDTTCSPSYSDVLSELPISPHTLSQNDQNEIVRIPTDDLRRAETCKIKSRSTLRRALSPGDDQKGSSERFIRQSLFTSDSMAITDGVPPNDILDFCAVPHSNHFERVGTSDIGVHEDDLGSMEPRTIVSRRVQQSQEELEEDLLAPELSILTGSTAVASSDGVLVSSLSDGGTIVTGCSVSGSSRRKSPVRPMQVLRTKTAHVSTTTSSGSQSIIGTGTDNSSYIFTSSSIVGNNAVYNRSLSEAELSHDENVLAPGMCSVLSNPIQQSFNDATQQLEDNCIKEGNLNLQSTSIVRMANLGNGELTVRSLTDRTPVGITTLANVTQVPVCATGKAGIAGSTTVSSGLLPSLLSQSTARPVVQQPVISRVFVSNNTTRPTTSATSKSVVSVSHAIHGSAASRRRPTILKRSFGAANSTVVGTLISQRQSAFETSEVDTDTSTHTPVNRTIGLFSPGQNQINKPGATSLTGDESLLATTTTSANVPTKLLQLVTSPLSQSHTNQTASDRLFGKRSANYNKKSTPAASVHSPNVQQTGNNELRSVPTSLSVNTSTTPCRYASVRVSADGKQYVFISSPRIMDQSSLEAAYLSSASFEPISEPCYAPVSVRDDNSDQIFPVSSCLPGAFKVEINGVHLLRAQPDAHNIINGSNDRQVQAILTSTSGTTTMAAT